MGKVAKSARAIMNTLWGTKGRPETVAYADRCAEQAVRRQLAKHTSLKVVETVKPSPAIRQAESQRTTDKWAAARARHGVKS